MNVYNISPAVFIRIRVSLILFSCRIVVATHTHLFFNHHRFNETETTVVCRLFSGIPLFTIRPCWVLSFKQLLSCLFISWQSTACLQLVIFTLHAYVASARMVPELLTKKACDLLYGHTCGMNTLHCVRKVYIWCLLVALAMKVVNYNNKAFCMRTFMNLYNKCICVIDPCYSDILFTKRLPC